jgi:hypothetical protein
MPCGVLVLISRVANRKLKMLINKGFPDIDFSLGGSA